MPAPLTPEERDHLRRVIVEEVLPRFGGDQSAAAVAIGVDQATINRLVTRRMGGSLRLAQAVARYLNDTPSRILGLGAEVAPAPKLREISGFESAMEEARRQVTDEYLGRLDLHRLERAADHRMVPAPDRIIPGLLIQLALCLQPNNSPPKFRVVGKK